MIDKRQLRKLKRYGYHGQAIAEFAIALPVLLLLLLGIFEVGRAVFIYSSVTNASRNASRYASAVGFEDTGTYLKYIYCDGIKDVAEKSAYLMNPSDLTITISYGVVPPDINSKGYCDEVGGNDPHINVDTGDRVTVIVEAEYKPMLNLIPIEPRTITSKSSRTILGIIKLDN